MSGLSGGRQRDIDLRGDTVIAGVLEHWPETALVFLDRGMACPGCAMAPFGTIVDAARHYDLDLEAFLADLRRTASRNA